MKQYKFKATIESAGSAAALTCSFPTTRKKNSARAARSPSKSTFDGVPYTGTMVKYGHPQHMLPVLKAIREQIGKGPGDTVNVVVERDEVRPHRRDSAGAFKAASRRKACCRL